MSKSIGAWKATTGAKYGNKKCRVEGVVCDSLLEGDRYSELLLLQKAGKITDLDAHVSFRLELPSLKTGRPVHICNYEADFVYTENGRQIVEDTKGVVTHLFTIKKRLMKTILDIDVIVLKRNQVSKLVRRG